MGLLGTPRGINFRRKFTPTDQFMKVTNDGTASDLKGACQGGDVGSGGSVLKEFADGGLAGESIGGSVQEIGDVFSSGLFQRAELTDNLLFAADLKSDFNGLSQFIQIDWFGQAVMGAAGAL